VASFTYTPGTVYAGAKVEFDASASSSADGEIVAYSWDFDGDGGVDATGAAASSIMSYSGEYDVLLTVTDSNGAEGISTQKLVVTVKLLER
jgi:bacillopeptidase F